MQSTKEKLNSDNAGLYIHVPFCKNKCPYCNFYSKKITPLEAESYTNWVINEFKKYRGATFDTVYFGGGTPSVLEPKLIAKIMMSARENFNILPESEITIEANPAKDLTENFKIYANIGINRLSLGMQSIVKEERLSLGRTAGEKEICHAINTAKENGITNISLDIMLGTPKETEAGLNETLKFIEGANVTHISAYMLKIEKGTPFFKLQNKLELPNEDFVANMYLKVVSELEAMGFLQYEISNFAKRGFESHHNTKYWTLAPYLGIGPTAHSFWGGRRFYYDENCKITPDGTGGTKDEKIMLGLRLKRGIPLSLLEKDPTPYINLGLMEEKDGNISFTPRGFLVSNTVIGELI